jgi:hypothetical protein
MLGDRCTLPLPDLRSRHLSFVSRTEGYAPSWRLSHAKSIRLIKRLLATECAGRPGGGGASLAKLPLSLPGWWRASTAARPGEAGRQGHRKSIDKHLPCLRFLAAAMLAVTRPRDNIRHLRLLALSYLETICPMPGRQEAAGGIPEYSRQQNKWA